MKKFRENKFIIERDKRLRNLPEFVYDFISSLDTHLEISTQIEYIKDIHNFLEFLLKSETLLHNSIQDVTVNDLSKLTERDIRNFLSYLTEYTKEFQRKDGTTYTQKFTNTKVGLSRKTSTLHTLYKYLINRKLTKIDPTINIIVKIPTISGRLNKLELDELDVLISTVEDKNIADTSNSKAFNDLISERDYVMILIMANTGIRISELIQLDIDDINIDKSTMIVHRKRDKIQVLDLPFDILESLNNFIEKRKLKNIEINNLDSKNALFLSLQNRRINEKTVRYALDKYRKRAGIQGKLTPHMLRRTFGNTAYNFHTNGDLYLTSKMLGHDSMETTKKYAEVDETRIKSAMNSFSYKDINKDK